MTEVTLICGTALIIAVLYFSVTIWHALHNSATQVALQKLYADTASAASLLRDVGSVVKAEVVSEMEAVKAAV